MPKNKKNFINRKTATSFLLVERSHLDKYAGDASAPQHALKDISRKKQQQKYGVFFNDDYDYLQHLRMPFSTETESTAQDDEEKEEEEEEEEVEVEEDNEEVEGAVSEEGAVAAAGLVIHEELFGWEDPVFEGRDLRPDEVDEDLAEAMMRAEAGEVEEMEDEEEEGEFPDDFVALASAANPEEDEEMGGGMSARQQAMMEHYFETLGGEAESRLAAQFGDEDEEEEEEEGDVVQLLREHRKKMEERGDDYHSQCLSLQIEKIVEDAVAYDVDEIRSRLSGVSCALTESMQQALDTDKRLAERSLVRDPDSLMSSEEKAENVARTLAMIEEKEESSEDEEDPVQAWVDFDRRPRVTSTIESERAGYVPMDSVLASCTVHPAIVSLRKDPHPRPDRPSDQAEEAQEDEEESPEVSAVSTNRAKGESAEEKRQRKAAVKLAQRERRVAKKENKLSFKSESARQRSTVVNNPVVHL